MRWFYATFLIFHITLHIEPLDTWSAAASNSNKFQWMASRFYLNLKLFAKFNWRNNVFSSNGTEVQGEYGLESSMNLEVDLSGLMDKESWLTLTLQDYLSGNQGKYTFRVVYSISWQSKYNSFLQIWFYLGIGFFL